MSSYINHYVGLWEDESGNRLSIRKVTDRTCLVSFLRARDHQPIRRPWYAGKPSTDMVAEYWEEYGPELIVELWEEGKGFTLHLDFEGVHILDDSEGDALIPALSRFEEDHFLDQFYGYFGSLKPYIRKLA